MSPRRGAWIATGLAGVTLLSACGGGGDDGQPSRTSFKVAGVITAATGSDVDGDVNDPFAPFTPNDGPASAQPLPNPVVVGGFASAVATGVAGDRFGDSADVLDLFRVTLAQGQVITLIISDHDAADAAATDLDLGLFDTGNPPSLIAASAGTGRSESITAPASGQYNVAVTAVSGLSNYTLTIGQPTPAAFTPGLRLGDEFVPGEVIVRFKDAAPPAGGVDAAQVHAQALGLQAMGGGADREMLFSLGDVSQRQQDLAALGVKGPPTKLGPWRQALAEMSAERRLKYDTIQAVKALRGRPDVLTADLNYIRRALLVPNDQFYPSQWHYPLINLPQAWDATIGDAGVIVAVIDTGVVTDHPDLASKLTGTGFDFVSDAAKANDGDGIDADADDPGDAATPGGSSFHGTHVAGTVGASTNNNAGVAGASWQTEIMPIRVLGVGGTGTDFDLIQGVRYAAGLSNDSGIALSPTQRAHIINLSLGGTGFSQTAQNAHTAARNNGAIIIAAAGNENTSEPSYPAAFEGVISVSAVELRKRRAPYSNFGATIDVAAPGGDMSVDRDGDGFPDGVLSTTADDSRGARSPVFGFEMGTSMAAPHVAGVVALMKAVDPALAPDQLDAVLAAGSITEDLANNGPAARDNHFGYGLIDALRAVQVANDLASGAPLPAILEIDPHALDFGNLQTSLTLTAGNAGDAPLTITGVASDQPWLTVTPADVDASGLGTYTAVVNRAGLVEAAYRAAITFTTDTAGSVTLPATMRVGDATGVSDTGFQFILLLDPDTLQTVATAGAGNIDGRYRYSFSGVAAGSYLILAGTNSDNDGFICDPGESCGGFPTLDQLQVVTVGSSDIGGLDFTSSFHVALAAASDESSRGRGFSRLPGKRFDR